MRTATLLRVGIGAAALFVGVLLVEGALRPGYEPAYHTGSALSLGPRGWVQIANFLLLGLAMLGFALGVRRTLNASVGAALIAVFGLAMVASGVFVMDPMRGYPPGTPPGTPVETSWVHQVHSAAGPIGFLALFGACLALSRRLHGRWRLYTLFTAIAGLALTFATAAAWQMDAANTGLIQLGLIVVYLSWVALLAAHLVSVGGAKSAIGAAPAGHSPDRPAK